MCLGKSRLKGDCLLKMRQRFLRSIRAGQGEAKILVHFRRFLLFRQRFAKQLSGFFKTALLEPKHAEVARKNPHTEVQLLSYHHPEMIADAETAKLNKVGFNHVCFAVDDLEAEVAKLTAAGVKVRNHMMDFHDRKLVFVYGPEDVTVEMERAPTLVSRCARLLYWPVARSPGCQFSPAAGANDQVPDCSSEPSDR